MAVPASALPSVLETHGARIPRGAAVLVLSEGLVAPLGTLPSAFVAEHCAARAIAALGGRANAVDLLHRRAPIALASVDRALRRELGQTLRAAGWEVAASSDVTGVELTACAINVAALAATAASGAGREIAAAAADTIFAELDALARTRDGQPDTFAGREIVDSGPRSVGQTTDAVQSVALLASAAREADVDTPVLDGLAALVAGRLEPERWTTTITEPPSSERASPIRAA
jgi:glycerol-3-phosphate dehydrogenase